MVSVIPIFAQPANRIAFQQAEVLPAPEPIAREFDPTVRIKDITFVSGDRHNVVNGEGLVVGLQGTGGRSDQTQTMARNLFLNRGIRLGNVNTQNMSSVFVSGKIPAYARKGETILVNVAVADDATSLRGGHLHQAVLRGIDNEIYAIAQGPVISSGIAAQGAASGIQKNHPATGVCEAIVEKEICFPKIENRPVELVLRNKEYSTAVSIANALNLVFPGSSRAMDAGTVRVQIPSGFRKKLPEFISMIGQLKVNVDLPARVVINQRTGTVVVGENVRISRVLFANESLIISTAETPVASQPNALGRGQTVVLPRTAINVFESGGTYNVLNEGITVGELARALNALAVQPSELVNVFTSLRQQGALQAELIID